jgi:hypothetical protein
MAKRYARIVEAPPERVWDAVRRQRFETAGLGRLLMALRGYGWSRPRESGEQNLGAGLTYFGFVKLEEVPLREVVFGIVGRFWKPRGDLRRVTPEEFRSFAEAGWAKGAMNVAVVPAGGATEVSTETRVLCFGDAARRRFRIYWTLIEPFSGLMRIELLRNVRREALRIEPQARRSG